MNYYEELGVSQEATEQEIRKAHRRLVKLMHPDAQPDLKMKMLAETQMRRLNSIVSTLSDPEQRRSYDEQLLAAHAPYRQAYTGRSSWRGIPWWLASGGLAIVLALVAVYVWADHLGSSVGSKSTAKAYNAPKSDDPSDTARSTAGTPSSSEQAGKSLGASYTPPVVSQPPPSLSDQPKVPAVRTEETRPSSGISATVVTDPPAVSAQPPPIIPSPAKPSESVAKTQPPPKPPEKSQSVVVVANHPDSPAVKTSASVSSPAPDPKKQAKLTPTQDPKIVAATNQKASQKPIPQPTPKTSVQKTNKPGDNKTLLARNTPPAKAPPNSTPPPTDVPAPKKTFSLPAGSLIARATPLKKNSGSQMLTPPRVSQSKNDYGPAVSSMPGAALPTATPPKPPPAVAIASTGATTGAALINSRDPLEGEWVYAPKEPERHRAGFYPPEYIDLKLFGSGDPGNLKGQYSAKYVVTDRPVSPEISFELASVSKGSRKFSWQSNTGAKGTLNIDTIDEHTIRVDWRTTSAVHGPALTSGTATLIRRQ